MPVVSEVEEGMMKRVLREALPQAFSKCLDDSAVLNWQRDTQVEIFGALLALAELAVQQLKVEALPSSPPSTLSRANIHASNIHILLFVLLTSNKHPRHAFYCCRCSQPVTWERRWAKPRRKLPVC